MTESNNNVVLAQLRVSGARSRRSGARDIAEEEAAKRNCPFYGRHAAMGLLLETGGNQCALIETSYSPCKMEMEDLPVDWKTCPVFWRRVG